MDALDLGQVSQSIRVLLKDTDMWKASSVVLDQSSLAAIWIDALLELSVCS